MNEAAAFGALARFDDAIALASSAREQLRSLGLGLRYGAALRVFRRLDADRVGPLEGG